MCTASRDVSHANEATSLKVGYSRQFACFVIKIGTIFVAKMAVQNEAGALSDRSEFDIGTAIEKKLKKSRNMII